MATVKHVVCSKLLYLGLFILISLPAIRVLSEDDVVPGDGNVATPITLADLLTEADKNKHLLVLPISTKCDESCKGKLDQVAANAKETVLEGLRIVSIADDELLKRFDLDDPLNVIFYNYGKPVIYSLNRETEDPNHIVMWIERATVATTTTLNDDNFEHLTQAATGATTGDWLVMFHKNCATESMHVHLASSAVEMYSVTNVATVNLDDSPKTALRFSVTKCPTYVLFKKGKYYVLGEEGHVVGKLVNFVVKAPENTEGKSVPQLQTKFDKLTDEIAKKIKETVETKPKELMIGGGVVLGVIIVIIISTVCFTSKSKKPEKYD